MKKREILKFLFGDEIIISFVISQSKDGYVFAPRIKGLDFHLTTYVQQDKIISHTTIVDKSKKEYSNQHEIAIKDFIKGILESLELIRNKSIKSYSKFKKCRTLSNEFAEILYKKTGLLQTDVDFMKLQSLEDDIEIMGKRILKRTRIGNLLSSEFPIGFNRKNIIVPISSKKMLIFHPNALEEVLGYILRNLGVEQFYEKFFSTDEGKKILSDLRERS